MLPNLFLIGAAKSGTTALHHFLAQHPDVFMSSLKEPNYFAFQDGRPDFVGPELVLHSAFERDRYRRERYELSVLDRVEYEQLFAGGRHRAIRGESSPAYLYFPASAARIARAVPDARIVAALRHPVERAYSKFLQMRRDGMEPLDDFVAAVADEARRKRAGWSPTWLYMDRGYYHRQLEPFFERFDHRRIHVLLYEDLKLDPPGALRAIFEFLGVDGGVPLDAGEQHNVSAVAHVPRSGLLYGLVARPYLLSAGLQRLLPEPVARYARPWARRLLLKRATPPPSAPLTAELKEELGGLVREDIERLAGLIRRDLSHWSRPGPASAARSTPGTEPRRPTPSQLRAG